MKRPLLRSLVLPFLCLIATPLFAASPYLRLGGGFERSAKTILRDRDCSSTQPPALFGCVAGSDGRSLAARGDFGDSMMWNVAAGVQRGRGRVELELARRSGVDFDAHANFVGVTGAQPVRAEGRSTSLFAVAALDLAPAAARVRPFVAAGVGAARNETGAIVFTFPSIAPNATTTIQGGTNTSFAWTASAGASVALNDALRLELAVRYEKLGTVATRDGSATIVRPTRLLTLDIAGTRARVASGGVTLSLRWTL
jgi:opacity protein-like surface antigen